MQSQYKVTGRNAIYLCLIYTFDSQLYCEKITVILLLEYMKARPHKLKSDDIHLRLKLECGVAIQMKILWGNQN
jgi:hypothetical protein